MGTGELKGILVTALCAFAAAVALAAGARPVPRPAMAARIAAEEDVYGIVHWGLNQKGDQQP